MDYDVIVVGAGASGLMAAKTLQENGIRTCVIEADETPGGRIQTFTLPGGRLIERGAEFIHGDLPLTKSILDSANLIYREVDGNMLGFREGQWKVEQFHDPNWFKLLKKLKKQKTDITIDNFLQEYFPQEEFRGLRQAARDFAGGFDLADTSIASILSVKDEWLLQDETQFRVDGGYSQLINYLFDECIRVGVNFRFNSTVCQIENQEKFARLKMADEKLLESDKVILTVSVGVLQSGGIQFSPVHEAYSKAISVMGFGTVIKFNFEFDSAFWLGKDAEMGFVLSDERIPTWWTQFPDDSPILTGWVGGPAAGKLSNMLDKQLEDIAFDSLSNIFKIPVIELKQLCSNLLVNNWAKNKNVLGGYSYHTVFSKAALEILKLPLWGKVYFAGEAFSSSESQGTVEAALQSGLNTAQHLITEPGKS